MKYIIVLLLLAHEAFGARPAGIPKTRNDIDFDFGQRSVIPRPRPRPKQASQYLKTNEIDDRISSSSSEESQSSEEYNSNNPSNHIARFATDLGGYTRGVIGKIGRGTRQVVYGITKPGRDIAKAAYETAGYGFRNLRNKIRPTKGGRRRRNRVGRRRNSSDSSRSSSEQGRSSSEQRSSSEEGSSSSEEGSASSEEGSYSSEQSRSSSEQSRSSSEQSRSSSEEGSYSLDESSRRDSSEEDSEDDQVLTLGKFRNRNFVQKLVSSLREVFNQVHGFKSKVFKNFLNWFNRFADALNPTNYIPPLRREKRY